MNQQCVLEAVENKVRPLVVQIEDVNSQPKTELNKRRLKNFFAQAKFLRIPLPALRAYLVGRRRLASARRSLENLPPHRRLEVAQLAKALGDTSELFQFEVSTSEDSHLQQLTTSR